MNPATFNALRSAIGLEQQTIASALGLGAHGKRSVERWCATITPPAHAVTYLLEMVDRYDKFLEGKWSRSTSQLTPAGQSISSFSRMRRHFSRRQTVNLVSLEHVLFGHTAGCIVRAYVRGGVRCGVCAHRSEGPVNTNSAPTG